MNRNFRLATSFVLTGCALVAIAILHEGCGASEGGADGGIDASHKDQSVDVGHVVHGDGGRDAPRPGDAKEADARDGGHADVAPDVSLDGSAPVLVELSVKLLNDGGSAALPLVPQFSPYVFDYYVRCPLADDTLEVSMTASPGADSVLTAPKKSASKPLQTVTLDVKANQAIVAEATEGPLSSPEYWVRCLPPDFPALLLVAHPEAGTPTPGYYLIGNFLGGGPTGGYAIVLNGDGVPVWYYRNPTGISNVDEMVDGSISYLQINGAPTELIQIDPLQAKASTPTGVPIDFHELRILQNGDYLIISSPIETHVDLTKLPDAGLGSCPSIADADIVGCDLIEFEPDSGKTIWSWRASDHFAPAAVSLHPIPGQGRAEGGAPTIGCDTYHCNAIDEDPANGNLLVSGREMDSVFYVEKTTGKVLWKMGGTKESLDTATYVPVKSPFSGQHDPRLQPGFSTCSGGQISLFDDETFTLGGKARGVVYDVKLGLVDGGCDGGEAGVAGASPVWQYGTTTASGAEGSHRISSDGSRIIGWGEHGNFIFTEVDDAGSDLLDLYSSGGGGPAMESYRAIKVPTSALDLNAMRATAGGP